MKTSADKSAKRINKQYFFVVPVGHSHLFINVGMGNSFKEKGLHLCTSKLATNI